MERLSLYKLLRNTAPNITNTRVQTISERQEKQRELFWGSRARASPSPVKKPSLLEKKKTRAQMLLEWKAKKMKKLEDEKKKQKPAFKVGAVQRKATGSPKLFIVEKNQIPKKETNRHKQSVIEIKKGMITRSMANKMSEVNVQTKKGSSQEDNKNKKEPEFFNRFNMINTGVRKAIDSYKFKVPKSVTELPFSKMLTIPVSPKIKRSRKSFKVIQSPKNISEKIVEEKTTKKVEAQKEKTAPSSKSKIIAKSKEKVAASERDTVGVLNNKDKVVSPSKVKTTQIPNEKIVFKCTKEKLEVKQDNKGLISPKGKVASLSKRKHQSKKATPKDEVITPKHVTPPQDDFQPIYHSPFVTVRSKTKRGTPKKSLIMDVDEHIKKEEKVFECRIFSFRKYLECETKRLLETCEKWKYIYSEFEEIPNDVEGDIDAVIGKTNLLTSDKFMQFKSLIDKCENGDPLIKIDDLQGFQDWVSIEVESIDKEFHRLEKKKCNNWKEELKDPQKEIVQNVKVVKIVKKKPMGRSNIRAHIEAARKLLKEGNGKNSPSKRLPNSGPENSIKATPKRNEENLLKEVLTSETNKRNASSNMTETPKPFGERRNSGLEIMLASQKNKLLTLGSPLIANSELTSVVDVERTPSRSILKKKPGLKLGSAKARVTFDQENIPKNRGLDEKYLRSNEDNEDTPTRYALKDIANRTPPRMRYNTRSHTISGHEVF